MFAAGSDSSAATSEAAWARSASRVRPEISSGTGPRCVTVSSSSLTGAGGACSTMVCALVPLMPNEETPARRGAPVSGHGRFSSRMRTAPCDQSTCDEVVGQQGPRQHSVPHGHDHLDDTGNTGRGLSVADVGLDGAEQQRPVLFASLAVGREQGLCLDRVTERGAGAVRLDGVDLGLRRAGS